MITAFENVPGIPYTLFLKGDSTDISFYCLNNWGRIVISSSWLFPLFTLPWLSINSRTFVLIFQVLKFPVLQITYSFCFYDFLNFVAIVNSIFSQHVFQWCARKLLSYVYLLTQLINSKRFGFILFII